MFLWGLRQGGGMILKITQYGDPVLRKKCRPVKEVTPEIQKLAEDMLETMREAQGIGIAAPQVGEELQLAIVDVSHDLESFSYLRVDGEDVDPAEWMPLTFFNAELEFGKEKEMEPEGCLSIQGIQAKVKRPVEVQAKMHLLDGREILLETDGLFSRAIQHEVDHLNGVLFTDRVSPASKVGVRKKLKALV